LNKTWRLVNFCEFDKYAAKSYCAVHNADENLNLGDITQVDETQLEDFTMMCGGSPCQDFSVAGKQKGALWKCSDCGYKYNPLKAHWSVRDKCPECGSIHIEKTRSSLLVEYLRILRAKHPKFAMYENVKNIVGKQFKETFDMFIAEINEYGYNAYWKVLNAKDYGIPQNRERVYIFIVDKELDNGQFKFPEGFDNGIRLKDVLDNEVEDKYYLSEQVVSRFISTENTLNSLLCDGCQAKREGKSREYNDFSPTLSARDYKDPRMINSEYDNENNFKSNFRIRKLTPKECWRLMGFSDENFNAAKSAGVSDSQLYKQAGNSIVTDVLYYIYLEIYKAMPYLFDGLTLTSLFSGIGAFEISLNRLFDTINSENFTQPQQKVKSNSGCGENKLIQVGMLDKPGWIEASRRVYSQEGVSPTLNGIGQGGNTEPKIIVVGRLDIKGKDQIKRVYDPNGFAPTLSTMQGGQQQPKVIFYKEERKNDYADT